jgi:hypothetical protein
MAHAYNHNVNAYPVFGLVYGQSKAGKTSFLETLLKMMIGQKTKLSAPDFTRSQIEQLKRLVKGAPIIVDDLTNARFNQYAVETIKNEAFGLAERLLHYPAVVISANEDVKAVAQEIIRRTVICHVQAGLKTMDTIRTGVVRRVQRRMGTALYREYLRRMLDIVPDMLEGMKNESDADVPDVLAASSEVLCAVMGRHYTGDVPNFIRPLRLDDYFGERVTGAQAIKTITDAWNVNREAFEVDKRRGQLRYNAGQTWEADRIVKELPEDLRPLRSREWVIMDLEKAADFFGVEFGRRRWF